MLLPASKTLTGQRATIMVAWLHRWFSIATCLLLAMWFASGMILLFVPFPALPAGATLHLMKNVPSALVAVTPTEALRAVPGAQNLRLIARGETPVYVMQTDNGAVVIDAATGERAPELDRAAAQDLARQSFGSQATVTGPVFDYDQWIVHNRFDMYRPFLRVDVNDSRGTQIYLSARTGEYVQRTDVWQRFWNWPGAVLHWLYMTPLRASYEAWDKTVWWLSMVAVIGVGSGFAIGLIRTTAVRRAGRPGLTYFRARWLRWHHLLGLFAGFFALSWIVSGWLSMDHGRLFSRGAPNDAAAANFAGKPLTSAASKFGPAELARIDDAVQFQITAIGGEPFLAVTRRNGSMEMLDAAVSVQSEGQLDAIVRRGIESAGFSPRMGPGRRVSNEDFYALAEGWPSGTKEYRSTSGPTIYVYQDKIVTVMDASRASYAWAYFALHTFNFPILAGRPALRKVLVLIPLIAGLLLSITGVVIGYSKLRKSLR